MMGETSSVQKLFELDDEQTRKLNSLYLQLVQEATLTEEGGNSFIDFEKLLIEVKRLKFESEKEKLSFYFITGMTLEKVVQHKNVRVETNTPANPEGIREAKEEFKKTLADLQKAYDDDKKVVVFAAVINRERMLVKVKHSPLSFNDLVRLNQAFAQEFGAAMHSMVGQMVDEAKKGV